MTELKYTCAFCGTPTDYQEDHKALCVDCFVKVKGQSQPVIVLSLPTTITPKTLPPYVPWTSPFYYTFC